MIHIKYYFILSFLLFFLTSCSEQKTDISGQYENINNAKEVIYLNNDGTYKLDQSGVSINGKYEYEKGQIKLSVVITDLASLQGDIIVDSGGKKWKKK